MSVAVITTKHAVGDVVYWHEPQDDYVQRGVVVAIEAECVTPGYRPEWKVTYSVRAKYATDPNHAPFIVAEEKLHDLARDAFPEPPPEVEAPTQEASA